MLLTAFAIFGALALLVWGLAMASAWRCLEELPILEERTPPPPEAWPKVSVLIAACNEKETMEVALTSLLRETYPDLEIIVVDDRSDDGTEEVLRYLSAADPRLSIERVETLPTGWLGKVHALELARRRAGGEWLLFSDADVRFQPGIVAQAVATAMEQRLDHLAVFPRIVAPTFWLAVAVAGFSWLLGLRLRPPYLPRESKAPVMGVGAFNLVRRAALEKTEGLAWLKMDVIDDCALALLIQRHGGRNGLALSVRDLSIIWYANLRALVRGLEKGALAVVEYRFWRLALFPAMSAWLYLTPLALLWRRPIAGAAGLTLLLLFQLILAYRSARRFQQPFVAAVCSPLGLLLVQAALVRGAWLAWRRGGALWRGTLYPLSELIRGRRFSP